MQRLVGIHKEEDISRRCFTYGDVSVSNILVKGGMVVCLIDFEMAGFYPRVLEIYDCYEFELYQGMEGGDWQVLESVSEGVGHGLSVEEDFFAVALEVSA